jgi:hypothetical protein
MIEQSKSKIKNLKSVGDSAQRAGEGGQGDSIGVRLEAEGVS